MAVAHHRHHCTLLEAKDPGSTEYSFLRPAKPANDDTMEGRSGLAVTIAQKSCQLPRAPPSLRSCHRGWMSCKRLATILHAFTAQIGSSTDRSTLHVGFDSFERGATLLQQHSIGYHRSKRQGAITTYIPGKDDPSCASSGASAGVVVHFSYDGLYFFLHSTTTSLSLVGPFHSPSSKLCYVVKRQARADGQVRENQISIALSARQSCDWRRIRFLFFNGNMGNIRTMNNVLRTKENAVDSSSRIQHVNNLREYSSTDSQDKWVFYNNYYPQIMSLLGEEPFEKGAYRNSFECPLEGDDDYSCRDSGIDIGTSRIHAEQGLHDTCDNDPQSGTADRPIPKSATEASTQAQYWSVDEMIALSLLEAMESRGQANYHVGGSRYRQSSTGRRRMSSMWKGIAKLFRKLRLA